MANRGMAAALTVGLATMAIASIVSMGNAEEVKWVNIEPHAIAIAPESSDFKIKVGPAYQAKSYDTREQLKLAIDLLVRPKTADAKRVFTVFDLRSLSAADYQAILALDDAGAAAPLAAFVQHVGGGEWIARPVKWNEDLGTVVRGANTIDATTQAVSSGDLMQAFAGDLMLRAAASDVQIGIREWGRTAPVGQEQQFHVALERAAELAGVTVTATFPTWTESDRKAIAAGDPEPLSYFAAAGPMYVGLSNVPESVTSEPVAEIVTVAGVRGETLGYTMPGWPSGDDQ